MIRGTITYTRSPEQLLKMFRPALKSSMRKVGLLWWRNMLPKHFQISGEQEYDYEPRTPEHIKFKIMKYRHRRPLVLTGRTERAAKRMARVTSTSKRVRVALPLIPRYFYQYNPKNKFVDKADELTRASQGDVDVLAKGLETEMTIELNAVKGKEVVKI